MIPLALTDYERGDKRPADLLPSEPSVTRQRSAPTAPLSHAERERRQAIVRRAVKRLGAICIVADRLCADAGDVGKWAKGTRPTPTRHLFALNRMAGGES